MYKNTQNWYLSVLWLLSVVPMCGGWLLLVALKKDAGKGVFVPQRVR